MGADWPRQGNYLLRDNLLDAEPTTAALDATVDAGLVSVDGAVVRFRHPLIRSAIYQSATVSQRHAAHAALAVTLANQPHRRAWHRAAATFGPDEHAAAELREVAEEAHQRGALAVTVAAFERAAGLSADGGNAGKGSQSMPSGRTDLKTAWSGWWVRVIAEPPVLVTG